MDGGLPEEPWLGVAISANEVKAFTLSRAHDRFSVERLVLITNSQVLCMGQRVIEIELAPRLARDGPGDTFDNGSASAEKVKALTGTTADAPVKSGLARR